MRGGTGCRIPIDLLTELEPVAESSGRKGEKQKGGGREKGWHGDRERQNERKRLTARVRAGGRKTVIPERIEIERGREGGRGRRESE